MSQQPAVLFIVFNRPDTTREVMAAIRAAQPQRLYVAADGARPGRAGEAERCAETRRIATGIDWPCTVRTLLRERNLGCRQAVSSAISWFFEQEEEGIILEDDCLPHPSFFGFCAELLEHWRQDKRIMSICGTNLGLPVRHGDASYGFTRTPHCWGWASWRRAWAEYDIRLESWPAFRDAGRLEDVLRDRRLRGCYRRVFDRLHAGSIDTWDWQWSYACWRSNGLCAVPRDNLVSNIGFGATATHTTGSSPLACLPTRAIALPLSHPRHLLVDEAFFIRAEEFSFPSLSARITTRLRRLLP